MLTALTFENWITIATVLGGSVATVGVQLYREARSRRWALEDRQLLQEEVTAAEAARKRAAEDAAHARKGRYEIQEATAQVKQTISDLNDRLLALGPGPAAGNGAPRTPALDPALVARVAARNAEILQG